MFKKKPNIPPRPKPPVTEQVLDDLKNAPEDDVAFMLINSISDQLKSSTITSSAVGDFPSSQILSKGVNNPEAVYQKVRNFLEANRNLQIIMQKLEVQNESLVTSNTELKKMAEDIRRQAVDALLK